MHSPRGSKPAPEVTKPAAQKRDERVAREAAALRANLLKRKQQTREREKPKEA